MQEAARELWKKRTSQGDAQAPHPGCRYQVGLNFTFRQHLDFSWGLLEDKCFLSIYGLTYQQMCPAADSEIWSGASIYRKTHAVTKDTLHSMCLLRAVICTLRSILLYTFHIPQMLTSERRQQSSAGSLIIAQSPTPSTDKYCPSDRRRPVHLLHLQPI